MSEASVDVVVVGAGPSGLTLALQAASLGARVRIVERRTEAFRPSRAIIVHARTLEVLRPLGVTEAILDRGEAAPSVDLHLGARVVPIRLGPFSIADTPFPFLVFVAQTAVEEVLAAALAPVGVDIEWGVELVDLRPEPGRAVAVLRRADGGNEEVIARYVAGCDGADSVVARWVDADRRSGRYRHEIVLADVELDTGLSSDVAHVAIGRGGLLLLLALGEQATWRLLATRPSDPSARPDRVIPDHEVQRLIHEAGLSATVADMAWASCVPLRHRLASRYRNGPVFVVGDAAHTHSPAGGQGMNTGIQDAANLGWKLAFASRSTATNDPTERLLDSYQAERRPVARRLLVATRALFWGEAGTDPVARFVRSTLGPRAAPLVPTVLRRHGVMARGIRALSQLRVDYRHSELSTGDAPGRGWGGTRPGDRLPDQTLTGSGVDRLHQLIARPGVHVLLHRDAEPLDPPAAGPWTHVHRVIDWPGPGVLIVRPDTYVGYRSGSADPDQIADWLASISAI
jgi:2-polyprenyl-6-methoxyphenol hydroxylase-like FAD-dependent oxidoreductase